MRGLGCFLVVLGMTAFGLQFAGANLPPFDWVDNASRVAGTITRASLIVAGVAIIAHSFYIGRHD